VKVMRVTGIMDRGTLKFRISRKGKVIGWLTLEGLVRWMAESQKPTTSGKVVGFTRKVEQNSVQERGF
jgi:hypothetical protein